MSQPLLRKSRDHSPWLADIPKIPHFDYAVVAAADQQVARTSVPANNIHVTLVRRINASDASSPFAPDVPYLNAVIGRTRREDSGF